METVNISPHRYTPLDTTDTSRYTYSCTEQFVVVPLGADVWSPQTFTHRWVRGPAHTEGLAMKWKFVWRGLCDWDFGCGTFGGETGKAYSHWVSIGPMEWRKLT